MSIDMKDNKDEGSSLVERLLALETGQVSDVLDEAGITNHALSDDLFSLTQTRFAGRAACVRGTPKVDTNIKNRSVGSLEDVASNGTVLFIDSGGFKAGAVLGGFVAYSLNRNGCQAIITDGPVRDVREIKEVGIGCYAASITPVNGARRWHIKELNVPIQMKGQSSGIITIKPGDFVLADDDGVVIIPQEIASLVIEDAEELSKIEKTIDVELRNGAERNKAFSNNPRFNHIRSVDKA